MTFNHLGDELRHEGFIWNLVQGTFRSPDGIEFKRDLVRSPGSVGVVALLADGPDPTVVLVRQYRPAFDGEIVEIPAGMRDKPGEAPADTARRELAEEVGLATDDELIALTEMVPSPGMTDAVCSVFLATSCYEVANDLQGPEEEHLTVLRLPLSEAVNQVLRGEIVDAKSVAGLLIAAARR